MIGRALRRTDIQQLVVIKSTVTPGTARGIVKPILERQSSKKAGHSFRLCSNPEFLREGKAIHDTEFPDRIVIGSDDPEAIKRLESVYREFHNQILPPTIKTSHENAELIKYANNAFLATKVSFANCIANIAERIPFADVKEIASGIGLDRRIGAEFLNAGLGWGGSCFPKDVDALLALGKKLHYNPRIVEAAKRTNRHQWRKAIELAKRTYGPLNGSTVAVLGLSFKPNTDDMRAAVSIPIIRELLAEGASVVAYDPAAMKNARAIIGGDVTYAKDSISCIEHADCCILVTEWEEFGEIPPQTFLNKMRKAVVIDGRRVYDADRFWRAGVRLSGVGLGPRKVRARGLGK
jgi:UDPglucose 6-dehydrogenase